MILAPIELCGSLLHFIKNEGHAQNFAVIYQTKIEPLLGVFCLRNVHKIWKLVKLNKHNYQKRIHFFNMYNSPFI